MRKLGDGEGKRREPRESQSDTHRKFDFRARVSLFSITIQTAPTE